MAIEDGQQHIKAKVLRELDSITDAMVEKAKRGGTAPLRLLWELGRLHEDATAAPKSVEPSLSGILIRDLERKRGTKAQQ